jgi:3-hydroxyacyl-CoA dehydrogenase
MRGFAGILVVLVLGLLIYKFYFTSGQAALGPTGPTQMIDVIGVKNDLISIAQAERIYQAEHNTYGSLDDLVSSGAMAYKKTGRQGYTYDAEASTDSFRVEARCTDPAPPGCTNFAIDQTMQISSTQ